MPAPVSPTGSTTWSPSTAGADRIVPRGRGVADDVVDRVRGVDDQVEEDLVDVAGVAGHGRQLAEVGLDVGDVLVLAGGTIERVAIASLRSTGVISLGRGARISFIDRTIARRARGRRSRGRGRRGRARAGSRGRPPPRPRRRARRSGVRRCVGREPRHDSRGGRAARIEVAEARRGRSDPVADELDRGVDLVRDAGGEPADRLELLRLTKLELRSSRSLSARFSAEMSNRMPCMIGSPLGPAIKLPSSRIEIHSPSGRWYR